MAGGRSATNRALPTAIPQALIDEKTRRGVLVTWIYLVVAGSAYKPETLATLGAFGSESLARAFIDRAPLPQRECLGIQRWRINQPTTDPFWTGCEIALIADTPSLDEAALGKPLQLDEAYLRFRDKLLLDVREDSRGASAEDS
jgi:hypothetical protein